MTSLKSCLLFSIRRAGDLLCVATYYAIRSAARVLECPASKCATEDAALLRTQRHQVAPPGADQQNASQRAPPSCSAARRAGIGLGNLRLPKSRPWGGGLAAELQRQQLGILVNSQLQVRQALRELLLAILHVPVAERQGNHLHM